MTKRSIIRGALRAAACALLTLLLAGCGPDESPGDFWDGDPEALVGTWRARDEEPQGRPYLMVELSGVYRVVVETQTRALEVERGSYVVDAGILVRTATRSLDPHQVGARTENSVYRVTDSELVLDPSDPGDKQLFYTRVTALPDYTPLP